MASSLWVDKYKPLTSLDIIGNIPELIKIKAWMAVFHTNIPTADFKNCLLISGPPGIGKTSSIHILLNEAGYDTIEFNASELRTSKIITEKLETILSGKSIQMMFNKKIKTAVIMDEVDGIESRRECSANDINSYINFAYNKEAERIKILNKTIKGKKLKVTKTCININPIICICNTINKSVHSLLKEVVHIKFNGPSESDIFKILKKINVGENLGISDTILNLIIPFCQNDLRRSVYILEYISGFIKKDVSNTDLIQIIQNVGSKDMDVGLYEAINRLFLDYDQDVSEILKNFHADQTFVPYIIHENFIEFMDKNIHGTYVDKLDDCIKYYEYLTDSQIFRNNMFGNWNISEYTGLLSCMSPNNIIKNSKLKNIPSFTKFEKSALISKYNYRFYNLKAINNISKKLVIDTSNFHIVSSFLLYSIFTNPNILAPQIKYLKSKHIIFKEFEKIMKLAPTFYKYSSIYTKKFQKNILSIFDNN